LKEMGQYGNDSPGTSPSKNMRPLSRTLEAALERVADDFPELAPLLATHRQKGGKGESTKDWAEDEGAITAIDADTDRGKKRDGIVTELEGEKVEQGNKGVKKDGKGTRKRSGLTLELHDLHDSPGLLGVVREETVMVNTLHPAWKKALATKQEEYHIVLVTALSLSEYLDPEKNPQVFLERLLLSWSEVGEQKTLL